MSFFSRKQLKSLGLKRIGRDVMLSTKASIYNPGAIEIGDFSRIDDFCVLSAGEGGISIGVNVHVAIFTSLMGGGRIELQDFSNISSRVSIYSSSDDYSGCAMSNPTIPARFTNVQKAPVIIGRHVIIGAGSVILPGVFMKRGSVAGSLSLVKKNCAEFSVYAGVPARRIGSRSRLLLDIEKEFEKQRDKANRSVQRS
jgi:galactoside O-acetyltransferase